MNAAKSTARIVGGNGDLIGGCVKIALMRRALVLQFVFVLLMSGCADTGAPTTKSPSQSNAPRAGDGGVAPVDVPTPLPSARPAAVGTQDGVATVQPASAPPTPSAAASAGKAAPSVANAPAKPPAAPAPAAQPLKQESTPPGVATQRAPPLDLASLEQRLKDTKAIGVLTKITLKNQVDDLLNQFRSFYQGTLKTTLADLRRSYDLLVLKVLSLLQDSDQGLATAIAASREAILGILSDPAKFARI
jgi:hypothetical protein